MAANDLQSYFGILLAVIFGLVCFAAKIYEINNTPKNDVVAESLSSALAASSRSTVRSTAGQSVRFNIPKQPEPTRMADRRKNMINLIHDDPLLLTVFTREVDILPEGISQAEFDKMTLAHYNLNIKEAPMVIPRNINFNFEKYTSDQDLMNKGVNNYYSHYVRRDDVGSMNEKLTKQVAGFQVAKERGSPVQFLKKRNVSKR